MLVGGENCFYTDSAGCHAVGTIWKSHGFLPLVDTPIAKGLIIADLVKVTHLPSKIIIIHYLVHTKEIDTVSLETRRLTELLSIRPKRDHTLMPPHPQSAQFFFFH